MLDKIIQIEITDLRRSKVGTGDRSERIRLTISRKDVLLTTE